MMSTIKNKDTGKSIWHSHTETVREHYGELYGNANIGTCKNIFAADEYLRRMIQKMLKNLEIK